jgi:poly(3-hydroxybutyrate) depolymerase
MLHPRRGTRDSGRSALSRREFLALAAGGAAAACGSGAGSSSTSPAAPSSTVTGRLAARPWAQQATLPAGSSILGQEAGRDDGIIYVPRSVDPDRPAPCAVMMHGSGGTSLGMECTLPLAEAFGVILLLPNSRRLVWDAVIGSFGDDAAFLDGALAHVFATCAIDPARITLGGLSEGATYALARAA